MPKAAVSLVLVLVAAVARGGVPRLIATSDRGTISEDTIACPDSLRQTDPVTCHQEEQKELRRLLVFPVIDAAACTHDLQPTPKERAAIDARVNAMLPVLQGAAHHFRTLIEALLTVQQGTATSDAAFARLDPRTFPREEFDACARTLSTAEMHALLAQDSLAELQRQLRESNILEVETRNLEQYIAATAAQERRPPPTITAELWREAIATIHLHILANDYVLPDFEGVERHEHTIYSHSQ